MGRTCAVPGCKTGYRSTKEKWSLFTVPKNIERHKKWQAAIPAIQLKPSYFVCEKHFEEKYILKESITRDSQGRIIAQIPYINRKLVESAVPTIFDSCTAVNPSMTTVVNQSPDDVLDASKFLKSQGGIFGDLSGVAHAESVHTSYKKTPNFVQNPDVLPYEIADTDVSVKQEIIQAEISCPYEFLESDVKSSQKCIQSEILSSHGFVQHDVPSSQGFVQREALPKQQLNESEHHSPHELVEHKVESSRECVQHEVLPLTEVDNIGSTSDNCVRRNSASTECGKYFNISITINDTASDVTTDKKNSITIPKSWGVAEHTEGGGQRVVFTNIVKTRENSTAGPIIDKCVEIKTDKTLCYSVYGRVIDPEGCQLTPVLTDTALLPKTLERFKNLNVCNGLGAVNVHHLSVDSVFQDWIRRWLDKNCTMISKRKRCEHCKKMRQRILRREARSTKTETLHRIRHVSNPIDKRKLIALRKKNSRARRVKNYSKRRIRLLTQSLTKKADEIASIRAEVLAEKFLQFQVPASQQTAVKQIISAATKRHTKSRRYSEEWIMLCMLMNIRAPGFYEFLRKNDILPLPCTKTIRSYFSLIQSKCGFDEQFGQLLKKHFDTKAPHQRHGILLLDEINLRKSVAVCSRNLTYVGLTDFGEDGPESTDIRDQATHGLVLMFQPLADTYTQPIAVFASKNPVKGEELTKLVVKAIIYLERSGAKIHGVIADGAATNAKMWSMLGVSGAMGNIKTWFTHPVDEERKVFVFSDTPHVIKNI